jgi:gliding motility-associated-like protein
VKGLGLSFTLLLLCLLQAHGQQFYVTNPNGIQVVDIKNGTPTSQPITTCSSGDLGIAMNGNTFYALNPFVGGSKLYKATITGSNIANCVIVATLTKISPNSLTVDNSGTLYCAAGNVLYKINPNNPTPVKLGTMPYTSGGDLAFYNNDLYMASPTAIIKVNLADPSQSSVYINIPNLGTSTLYGLTAATVNNVVKFYAFAVSGSASNGQTDVLELDMANQKVIGTTCTLPYAVYDAASLAEGGTTANLKIDTVYTGQVCTLNNKGQVQIVATPDATTATLTYTLNNTSNTTGLFTGLSPGNYPVNITSSTGVKKDTAITVPDYSFNKATVRVTTTNPICNVAGKIQFNISNSNLYTLQYQSAGYTANHAFSGLAAGSYMFNIINQGGCPVDTLNVTLNQEVCYPQITFPNTFTPNDDGVNDFFKPNQDGYATNYTLTIYDRWGAAVFVSNDLQTGWNGQYKGKPAGVGTYYWMANYTGGDGKKSAQQGSVTLIR